MPHSLPLPGPRLTPGTSVVLRAVPHGPIMTVTSRIEHETGAVCTVKWLDYASVCKAAHIQEVDLARA